MSIKGIDAQLMITRAADLARDASQQVRKNELVQDYLSAQMNAQEQFEIQKAPKTNESEKVKLNLDKESEREGSAKKRPSASSKQQKAVQENEVLKHVPSPDSIIDVII